MDNKINISVENGVNEIVVRNGEAERIHTGAEVKIGNVTIFAIMEFLSKSNISENLILDSVLLFAYDKLIMELVYGLTQRHSYRINS